MKNQNKRIIALDVGTKTVGIAQTDPLGLTIQPLTTLRYSGPEKVKNIFLQLFKILTETPPQKIVVGLPLNMNDSEGSQSRMVKNFVGGLKNFLKKNNQDPEQFEWIFWDERLTTVDAEKFLIEQDVSRKKRKQVIDKMAAVYILKSYVEESKP